MKSSSLAGVGKIFDFLILDLWACGRAVAENRLCLASAEAAKGFADEVTGGEGGVEAG